MQTDDGFANLEWQLSGSGEDVFFRLNEIFENDRRYSYLWDNKIRVHRSVPGSHEFTVQACHRDLMGLPACGPKSTVLSLDVTENVRSNFVESSEVISSTVPEPAQLAAGEPGGPGQLRPGLWYNPAQDGHGYSFYWTNRLALPADDASHGPEWDLNGIWFTYEAKTGVFDGAQTVFLDYQPIAARLKLVHEGGDRFAGGLFIQRNGAEILEGSVSVIFGTGNTNALVNWSADFKLQYLSGQETVEFLAGSNPNDDNNATHYSGTWNNPVDDRYEVVDTIGAVSEAVEILFEDAVGDTTWVQGANEWEASPDAASLCFHYIESGYAPGSTGEVQYTDIGCEHLSPATYLNRNGVRQFTGFERLAFWADILLPHGRGGIKIGSSDAPAGLQKTANFHRIVIGDARSSCDLRLEDCAVALSWFSGGDYPRMSVFRLNMDSFERTLVAGSAGPAVENHATALDQPGWYRFELRMGDTESSALMAQSGEIEVIRSEPPGPEPAPANPDIPPGPASRPSFTIDRDSVTAGATQGAFSVDEQGAAVYRIAVAAAPGSGGFAPDMSLVYNSHGGNGIGGVGWSIGGQSSITRCPQTREQDGIDTNHRVSLDWSDRFCLDGRRLISVNGADGADGAEYRFELDDHSRVFSRGLAGKGPASFEVQHGDGSVSHYGSTPDSRVEARVPGDAETVMTWAISRRQDGAGNYILYEYDESSTGAVEATLEAVRYTGNARAATKPYAEIRFHYSQGRDDIPDSHFLGGLASHRRLLTRIDSMAKTRAGDSSMGFLRSYFLGYGQDGFGRKVLESVEECSDGSKSYCFEPTQFSWIKTENVIAESGSPAGGVFPKRFKGMGLADVNGDGLTDLLLSEGKKTFVFKVAYAAANGAFRLGEKSYPIPSVEDGKNPVQLRTVDLDGNGFQDVIYPRTIGPNVSWVARFGSASGFSDESVVADGCCNFLEPKVAGIIDYNGDGLADLLTHTRFEPSSWKGDLVVLLNTGNRGPDASFSEPVNLVLDFSADLFPEDKSGRWYLKDTAPGFAHVIERTPADTQAFDYNGDGNIDLLARVDQRYIHCDNECVITAAAVMPTQSASSTGWDFESLPPGEGNDGEYTVGFYIVFESDGAGRFSQSEVVAKDASMGCEVPVACDPWANLPLVKKMVSVDVNGDGLADLAYLDDRGYWSYRLNSGAGFREAQPLAQPVDDETAELARFADLSGDGFPEFLYPESINSNGAEWLVHANDLGSGFGAAERLGILHGNHADGDVSILQDFNGDGMADNLLVDFRNGRVREDTTRLFSGVSLIGGGEHEAVNQVGEIVDGLGKRVLIRYGSLTQKDVYTRLESAPSASWGRGSAVFDLLAPVYVVRSVSRSAPTQGNSDALAETEFHYVGGRLQAGGRGFLGFAEVVQWNSAHSMRINTRYRQDFPYVGLPFDETQELAASANRLHSLLALDRKSLVSWPAVSASMDSPGSMLPGTTVKYTANRWRVTESSGSSGAWQRTRSADFEAGWSPNGEETSRKLVGSSHDEHGRVTRTFEQLWGGGTSEAASAVTTDTVYLEPGNGWNLGLVETVTVTHKRPGVPEIIRKSSFAYDSVTGLKVREVTSPDSDVFRVESRFENDRFGNRISTTVSAADVPARRSLMNYDGLGRFAVAEFNHFGQEVTKVHDWNRFGTALEVSDIDGVVTQSAADVMGRVFANWTATGAWDRTTRRVGEGADCPSGTVLYSRTSRGGQPGTLSCLDLMNREIRTAAVGFDGRWIFTDTAYDAQGRVSRVSEPYFEGDARYWNITYFDAAGRLVRVDSAGGDDLWIAYGDSAAGYCGVTGPEVVETINALGQKQIEVRNAMGEVEEVYDDHCERVSYHRDSIGNLIEVTGVDRERVRMTYDALGRKLSTHDPDKGRWQYAWNALGEMTRQLDAKGQAMDYEYDAMGRVTLRRELSRVDSINDGFYVVENRERTRWNNSSQPGDYGKGQPAGIDYESGADGALQHGKTFLYDEYGRISRVITELDGLRFEEQTTYDQFGRTFQEFDASGDFRGLRYRYNAHGYLDQLAESRDGPQAVVYRDIEAMDARGNVTYALLGNGVEVFAGYTAAGGQLERLEAYGSDGGSLQHAEYHFDVLGNLNRRTDLAGGRDLSEAFSYDSLNRLLRVELTAPSQNIALPTETLSLEYDASGNITWKSDVGQYRYGEGTAGPHAVTFAGGQAYAYDANGNQVSGDGRTIQYSLFDKVTQIEKSGQFTRFAYGIAHKRISRVDQNDVDGIRTTRYIGDVEYIAEGDSTWFRRNLAGTAVAEFHPAWGHSSTRYAIRDHLGSIHSLTGEDGRQESAVQMSFDAFGARRESSWTAPLGLASAAALNRLTNRGYTGHEHADAMGLVHMNGRIYDPKLGRFLQADPVLAGAVSGQALNRYSYALNNPLSYTDPSGYFLKRLVKRWGRLIAALALSVVLPGGQGILATVFNVSNVYTQAAITGFIAGAITSGSLKGAAIGALTAVAVAGVVEAYSAGKVVEGLAPPKELLPNDCTGHHLLGANKHSEGLYRIYIRSDGIVTGHKLITPEQIANGDSIFTNGIRNDFSAAVKNATSHLHQAGLLNNSYVLNYNATNGFFADLVEASRDIIGAHTGWTGSGLAKNMANLIDRVSQNGVNGIHLVGHSQGGAITASALRYASKAGLSLQSLAGGGVAMHGAPVNAWMARTRLADSAGVTIVSRHQFGDAVHVLGGLNVTNPIELPVTLLRAPALFSSDPSVSPHSLPCGGGTNYICGW